MAQLQADQPGDSQEQPGDHDDFVDQGKGRHGDGIAVPCHGAAPAFGRRRQSGHRPQGRHGGDDAQHLRQGGRTAPPAGVEAMQQQHHQKRGGLGGQTADQGGGQIDHIHPTTDEGQNQQAQQSAVPDIRGAAQQLAPGHGPRIGGRQTLYVPGALGHLLDEGIGGQPPAPQHQQEEHDVLHPLGQIIDPAQMQSSHGHGQQGRHQHQPGRGQLQPQTALQFGVQAQQRDAGHARSPM